MNRILLVEDNESIVMGLRYLFTQEKYDFDAVSTVEKAEDKIMYTPYDIVILDISLPDGTGYDVLSNIRDTRPELPVLILTARDSEDDVVRAFSLGAEDYVVKPFRNRELMSRISAILRRSGKDERIIISGDLKIDTDSNRVFLSDREVVLTGLEYRLLVLLYRNMGKTVTRDIIYDRIWDYSGNAVNDNTLTVYIKRIRDKIGEGRIVTVKGIGYRAEDEKE